MPECTPSLLIVVAAALVDTQGRVLVQQRPDHARMGGLWEFPGGKLEAGELPEEALVRELREELDIRLSHTCLAPACFAREVLPDGQPLLLLLFIARKWTGVPKPIAASALQWARPIALHALPMPPADRPLIGLLEALI